MKHVEDREVIRVSQHGYTKDKPCLANLVALFKQLTSSVDSGIDVDVIYLEFCKAFDRVPHYIISSKLERCGFSA